MKTYEVLKTFRAEAEGDYIQAGTQFDMPEEVAEDLLAAGVIGPVGSYVVPGTEPPPIVKPEGEEDLIRAIVAAMMELDPKDPEQWNNKAGPNTAILSRDLGYEITADERTEAWKAYQKDPDLFK